MEVTSRLWRYFLPTMNGANSKIIWYVDCAAWFHFMTQRFCLWIFWKCTKSVVLWKLYKSVTLDILEQLNDFCIPSSWRSNHVNEISFINGICWPVKWWMTIFWFTVAVNKAVLQLPAAWLGFFRLAGSSLITCLTSETNDQLVCP